MDDSSGRLWNALPKELKKTTFSALEHILYVLLYVTMLFSLSLINFERALFFWLCFIQLHVLVINCTFDHFLAFMESAQFIS